MVDCAKSDIEDVKPLSIPQVHRRRRTAPPRAHRIPSTSACYRTHTRHRPPSAITSLVTLRDVPPRAQCAVLQHMPPPLFRAPPSVHKHGPPRAPAHRHSAATMCLSTGIIFRRLGCVSGCGKPLLRPLATCHQRTTRQEVSPHGHRPPSASPSELHARPQVPLSHATPQCHTA